MVRIALRVILWTVLSWFLLLLLWLFLPYPSVEHDGDNGVDYASRVLRAGKTLTRVYEIPAITNDGEHRHAFALDYKLHIHNLTLTVSGTEMALSYSNAADAAGGSVDVTQNINVTARVGDDDGANPPWFPIADSILLFWWIHKENATIPLRAKWISEEDGGLERLELWSTVSRLRFDEPLLVIQKEPNDTSKISAIAPAKPDSSSPSLTYPLRIAIIYVLAPLSIFINDLFGDSIAFIFRSTMIVLFHVFVIVEYVLLASVVIIALWLCLGRRTLGNGERILDRLQRVSEYSERLLRIATTRRRSDQRQNNGRMSERVNHEGAKYAKNTRKADIETGALDG